MSLANWPHLGRRVVVTGLGAITPLGHTVSETWTNLIAGKSGAAPITLFDAAEHSVRFACEVKDYSFDQHLSRKEQRKMGRFMRFGVCASLDAWKDAGFEGRSENNKLDPFRVGTYLGSGIGGITLIENAYKTAMEKSPKRISTFFIPGTISNLISGHVSILLGAQAHCASVVSACASGNHSIGESALLISRGDADIMIAGGAEEGVGICSVGGFASMKALSTRNDDPSRASRPFDRDRDGFVVGEGSGVLVLEEYEHAKKRNARIYGEVTGYASNADAYHMTAPSPSGGGAYHCMKQALAHGKISLESVDYINTHGTSTPLGDLTESQNIELLFQDHAKKMALSSTKSMTGHLLGAAGGIESCFSLKALETGEIPPTINLENQDEECRLNYTPNEAVQKKCTTVLNNSFGFGGTNSCLVFSKV